MLSLILQYSERAKQAIDLEVPLNQILTLGVREDLGRMKIIPSEDFNEVSLNIKKKINEQFDALILEAKNGGSL